MLFSGNPRSGRPPIEFIPVLLSSGIGALPTSVELSSTVILSPVVGGNVGSLFR
jgi:hypothetical protein